MVVSYIKVNEKTYSLEALSERFVHIPTRKFVEIFRHNNVVLPRLLRMILLRKYLTPCIHDPKTNSYFSKELVERLQYYEYFTEYQLEELLALLKEDIDYTLYVKDFWLDVLGMKDVLELSNGLLDLLDSQVDKSFEEYNILTFNILTSHIFGDKYGFIDGVSTEQLKMILNKSATVTTLRNIAKKYNVSLPQKMTRNFFANLIVTKYKEDPQYEPENLKVLAEANIKSLEQFADNRNYNISANDELGSYIEYVALKANVRLVNDIVYSGYVLSKKNSGDSFVNRLNETKSSESILDGNHIQLYTSHEEAFEDFEYDESLVAKMQIEDESIQYTTRDNRSLDANDSQVQIDLINYNDDNQTYDHDEENEDSVDMFLVDYNETNMTDTNNHELDINTAEFDIETQDLEVFNNTSSLLDIVDEDYVSIEFDSLFAEKMSMEDTGPSLSLEQVDNKPEIINLSDEIRNIDTVLSGRKEADVIFGQIEESTEDDGFDGVFEDFVVNNESSEVNDVEFELSDESAEVNDVDVELGEKDITDDNIDIELNDDDFEIEIEDLNLENPSLTDLDLDFDSSGAKLEEVEQFKGLSDDLDLDLDFGNLVNNGELFFDESDEGFDNRGVDAPEFDRVFTIEDNDNQSLINPITPILDEEINGVSQDLIIGQLDEVKFDYDELDSTEARQINDFETVSNLIYTTEATEPITVEDDSYDLDLDMKVDLTYEVEKNDTSIDYNRIPELSVKVDTMGDNVFDIDVELPPNTAIHGRIGDEEDKIQKSATLDEEFERFLKEVDELQTTSVLEFDDGVGKYKFEISDEDIQKLKKGGKSSSTSLDEKEDELLAALSDLD